MLKFFQSARTLTLPIYHGLLKHVLTLIVSYSVAV